MQILNDKGWLKLSNRRALFTKRLRTIKIGDLITGKIRAIKDYGLFVNIGEGSVLLHISEISHEMVKKSDLNNIFNIDDEIKVIVVWMDIRKGRVAVSTKELEEQPGDMLKNSQLVYQNSELIAERHRKLVLEKLDIYDSKYRSKS